MEHLIYRQEIQETTEYQESFHDIIQCVIIQRIDQSQRNGSSDQSDEHAFQYERCTHEKVRGTDIFHDIDLFRPHGDTDSYGIADQEDADCQQDHDDSHGHVGDQKVQTAQCVGCHFGIVDLAHLWNGLQPGHQCILHGHIAQENLIAVFSRQRILRETFRIILAEIVRSEGSPCLVCGFELYVGYLGTLGDLLSDLFYLLFGRNLSLDMTLAAIPFTMEKYGHRHAFLRCLQDVLEVSHDGVEQSKQKQACRYGRNRCQGIPFISENIDKSLLDRI